MYDRPLTIEQILTLLAATPARLADLTDDLPPAQLLAPPEPGEWSARDVLAHLRACADMWGMYTVYTYAQWLTNHEQSHIKQIARIVNAMRM